MNTEEMSPEVYVSNIPFTATEEDIRMCCSSFGDVVRIKLQKRDGRFKGYVKVERIRDRSRRGLEQTRRLETKREVMISVVLNIFSLPFFPPLPSIFSPSLFNNRSANVLFRTKEGADSMATSRRAIMVDGRSLNIKQQPNRLGTLFYYLFFSSIPFPLSLLPTPASPIACLLWLDCRRLNINNLIVQALFSLPHHLTISFPAPSLLLLFFHSPFFALLLCGKSEIHDRWLPWAEQ